MGPDYMSKTKFSYMIRIALLKLGLKYENFIG